MDGEGRRQGSIVAGAVLVAIGLLLLLVIQFGIGGEVVPAMVGVGFLVVYAFRRVYGFLVAGMILLGVGAGAVVETHYQTFGTAPTLGIGLGFAGIYAVDVVLHGRARLRAWWPLVPGGVLTFAGLAIASQNYVELAWLRQWWPVALVLLGLLLLMNRSGRSRMAGG